MEFFVFFTQDLLLIQCLVVTDITGLLPTLFVSITSSKIADGWPGDPSPPSNSNQKSINKTTSKSFFENKTIPKVVQLFCSTIFFMCFFSFRKDLYKTVWEIKQRRVLDLAADRGKYIDQSQSLHLRRICDGFFYLGKFFWRDEFNMQMKCDVFFFLWDIFLERVVKDWWDINEDGEILVKWTGCEHMVKDGKRYETNLEWFEITCTEFAMIWSNDILWNLTCLYILLVKLCYLQHPTKSPTSLDRFVKIHWILLAGQHAAS